MRFQKSYSSIRLPIILIALTGAALFFPGESSAQGIRVVPHTIYVRNDSLRIQIDMDLNAVHAKGGTAIIFTPVIRGKGHQTLALPPVVVSGARRARQDRREAFLSRKPDGLSPYIIIRDNKGASKTVDYQIAVPYASWMRRAALLFRQERKECCGPELLAVDTISHDLRITSAPETALSGAGTSTGSPAGLPPTAMNRKRTLALAPSEVSGYASMVSVLVPDPAKGGKHRAENVELYLDYPQGKDDIYPDFKDNRGEIDKIDRVMRSLAESHLSSLAGISVRGYSSPEGAYGDNERLSKARSTLFANYMLKAYQIPRDWISISSVGEDWEGLIGMLQRDNPPYEQEALEIIRQYGVFEGREKQLMDLRGGVPYKDMLRRLFPALRRIEVAVSYDVRSVNVNEANELIYTHPDLLSLGEMYEVARFYRPGTDQYREVYEVAAFHFPDDVIANVNAASAVMLTGDLTSTWEYLRKVEADPRAWNNMGVLTLMEGDPQGAVVWFRKAVGVEPVKARNNLEIASGLIQK